MLKFMPAFSAGLKSEKALFVEFFPAVNDALYSVPVGSVCEYRNKVGCDRELSAAAPASTSLDGVSVRVEAKLANRFGSKIPNDRIIAFLGISSEIFWI